MAPKMNAATIAILLCLEKVFGCTTPILLKKNITKGVWKETPSQNNKLITKINFMLITYVII